MCFGEVLYKGCLADSRLATYKHQTALTFGDIVEYGVQFNFEFFALE
jgi:hypothetical protein